MVLGATFGGCVGLAQRGVLRFPAGVSARLICGKAAIWTVFFWTINGAVELRESGVAVYTLIGILCGIAEAAISPASLREIIRRLDAWSLVSPLAYGVGAFVFSRLLMSPTKDDFALLILPCLSAEIGTGIAMTRSVRIQEALMGLSEAWTEVKAWIRARGIIKCALVIYSLIDFVLLLELTQRERDEILRSGQDIDFWYSPAQMAALGPGLLLLCCLGLFLGKAPGVAGWACCQDCSY
jgi:hypothetical protein